MGLALEGSKRDGTGMNSLCHQPNTVLPTGVHCQLYDADAAGLSCSNPFGQSPSTE